MTLGWLDDELRRLDKDGLVRRRREVIPLEDGYCQVGGERLCNFSSNDYLGLAGDRRIAEAAKTALDAAGAGARASALVSGRTDWHVALEDALAAFEETETAILFPTGFAANLGVLSALASAGDVLLCDRLNHASLIDGCRVSGASLRVYRHDDLETLERELRKAAKHRRRFIVTDAVFSMDGDHAPLKELCDLAERFDASVIVDEAHGTGVFGQCGRGICELCGVEDRVAVRIGTLSKAIGALGGFVAGSNELVQYLWNKARTTIYSTALPPSVCAAAAAAVRIIQDEPERRTELLRRCRWFHQQLRQTGLNVASRHSGPIVPIVLGESDTTMRAAQKLEEFGFLVGAIRPPTVPRGTARLRIALSYAHQESVLRELLEALTSSLLSPPRA